MTAPTSRQVVAMGRKRQDLLLALCRRVDEIEGFSLCIGHEKESAPYYYGSRIVGSMKQNDVMVSEEGLHRISGALWEVAQEDMERTSSHLIVKSSDDRTRRMRHRELMKLMKQAPAVTTDISFSFADEYLVMKRRGIPFFSSYRGYDAPQVVRGEGRFSVSASGELLFPVKSGTAEEFSRSDCIPTVKHLMERFLSMYSPRMVRRLMAQDDEVFLCFFLMYDDSSALLLTWDDKRDVKHPVIDDAVAEAMLRGLKDSVIVPLHRRHALSHRLPTCTRSVQGRGLFLFVDMVISQYASCRSDHQMMEQMFLSGFSLGSYFLQKPASMYHSTVTTALMHSYAVLSPLDFMAFWRWIYECFLRDPDRICKVFSEQDRELLSLIYHYEDMREYPVEWALQMVPLVEPVKRRSRVPRYVHGGSDDD